MSCYISSRDNRYFVKAESAFGTAAPAASADRVAGLRLEIKEQAKAGKRRDKIGGRTFAGVPNQVRRDVEFSLEAYLTSWDQPAQAPAVGALWESVMGGAGTVSTPAPIVSVAGSQVTFSGGHGLQAGQGVAIGGDLRFVAAVPSAQTVILNAPLSQAGPAGSAGQATASYGLATKLKSVSLWDYWSPVESVQRGLAGAVVDVAEIDVNGDYHSFRFQGPAAELIDSSTFASGEAGLSAYPDEPDTKDFNYSIVPGHLGEVWAGPGANQLLTLSQAKVRIKNRVELTRDDFGTVIPKCVAAGEREVTVAFEIYADDQAQTVALYQAARTRTPISLMFQLGQQAGQMFGVYMPAVVLETPEFDDRETRLRWQCTGRAQGSYNDELFVAFA